MIYGRRFFLKPGPQGNSGSLRSHRGKLDIKASGYYSFRGKYLLFLVTAILGSLAIFFVPTIFFVKQNYDIFTKLAYDTHPELLAHLEREYLWILGFLAVSLVALGSFCFWIGFKVTRAIITPLHTMEVHMKKATLGDWSKEDCAAQNSEDLRSLIDTYNYLYRSIRAQTESDIRYLQKLVVDPAQREAFQTLQMLIQSKREQLGFIDDSTHSNPSLQSATRDQKAS